MFQKDNRMVLIPAISCLVILMSISIACVSASPQLPCEFYGPITINGAPAPAGTVITAYVNSVEQGKIAVKEPGKYGGEGTFEERLIVQAEEDDFSGGTPTITFKIGDKVADQTAQYEPGMSTELSMSIGGGAAAALASATSVSSGSPVSATSLPAVPGSPVTPATVSNVTPVIPASPTVQAPVVPVVTVSASPANQTVPAAVPVVTAAPVPVITTAPVPVATLSTGNGTTNSTMPVNVSPSVSFPSGQTVTA